MVEEVRVLIDLVPGAVIFFFDLYFALTFDHNVAVIIKAVEYHLAHGYHVGEFLAIDIAVIEHEGEFDNLFMGRFFESFCHGLSGFTGIKVISAPRCFQYSWHQDQSFPIIQRAQGAAKITTPCLQLTAKHRSL
jgi:hypothetical protein